jgi:phage host-nuclease inhibitor protein Gam
MFNLWPKKKSVDEMLKNVNTTCLGLTWIPEDSAKKDAVIKNLREQQEFLYKENEDLKKILENIEEDGTYEHNNAIKLREENVNLKGELETVELEFNLVLEINNDLNKKLIGLNHLKEENVQLMERINKLIEDGTRVCVENASLKEENVQLMERVNEIDSDINKEYQAEIFTLRNDIAVLKARNAELLKNNNRLTVDYNGVLHNGGLKYMEAKYQILEHNYQGCTKYRDEYKHQLNAANKEIEALKKEKKESFNILKKAIEDESNRFDKLMVEDLNLYNENKNLKAEIKKLKEDIVDYVIKKDDEVNELKKTQDWNKLNKNSVEKRTEKYYVCNHCGYKVAHDTNYWGGCGFCKEGLMIEKEEKQKHPMYPIHWGGIDSDILKQAKEQSIEVVVDALKGMKTQGFEDYDPRDVVKTEKQIAEEELLQNELKRIKDVEFNSEELLKRVTEYADSLPILFPKDLFNEAKGLVEGVEVNLEAPLTDLPRTFPNEFQEETTAENLEEKFDKGEDVLDYYEKPWQCPCIMCKHTREESQDRSWEQAASDLALRVVKLEKKIEELTIINNSVPYSAINSDGTLKTINC